MSELSHIDIDLSGIELGVPQIDNQITDVLIAEARVKEKEGDQLKKMVVKLVLEQEATSTTGNVLPVGKEIETSVLLEEVGGMTMKRIAEELAKWKAAAAGIAVAVPGPFGSTEQLVGKRIRVKWSVGKKGFQNVTPLVFKK